MKRVVTDEQIISANDCDFLRQYIAVKSEEVFILTMDWNTGAYKTFKWLSMISATTNSASYATVPAALGAAIFKGNEVYQFDGILSAINFIKERLEQ